LTLPRSVDLETVGVRSMQGEVEEKLSHVLVGTLVDLAEQYDHNIKSEGEEEGLVTSCALKKFLDSVTRKEGLNRSGDNDDLVVRS